MDIRVLRYFLAVAEEGNITAAAGRLHVTQPTLSRQLKELESELNTTLFERGNRKIRLTAEGQFLFQKAKEMVSLMDKTITNFNKDKEIIGGDIFIGAGETRAMAGIAQAISELREAYPAVHVHMYSGNADEVKEKLDSGLLDFGIVIEPTDKEKYDFLQLGVTDTWGLLMRKDHPLAEKESIPATDLVDLPLLVSRQTTVSNEFSGWMNLHQEQLHIIGTYNLLFNAALMVEEGVGCALCIEGIINTTGNSILCFRPLTPSLGAPLHIIWKKNQVFSTASRAFLEKFKRNLHLATPNSSATLKKIQEE